MIARVSLKSPIVSPLTAVPDTVQGALKRWQSIFPPGLWLSRWSQQAGLCCTSVEFHDCHGVPAIQITPGKDHQLLIVSPHSVQWNIFQVLISCWPSGWLVRFGFRILWTIYTIRVTASLNSKWNPLYFSSFTLQFLCTHDCFPSSSCTAWGIPWGQVTPLSSWGLFCLDTFKYLLLSKNIKEFYS